jgi:hypothetical protein
MLEVPRRGAAAHQFREVPPWLPRGVMQVAKLLWPTLRPTNQVHVRKIACAPEMQPVWKELRERVKDCPPDGAHVRAEWLRTVGATPDPALNEAELSLGLLFYAACAFAVPVVDDAFGTNVAHLIRTEAEHYRLAEKQRNRIEVFRETARHFRLQADLLAARRGALEYDPEIRAQQLDDIADILERERGRRLVSFIVSYKRGDRRVRAYVLCLAEYAQGLFGRVNYRTIATVANVALNLEDKQRIKGGKVNSLIKAQAERKQKLEAKAADLAQIKAWWMEIIRKDPKKLVEVWQHPSAEKLTPEDLAHTLDLPFDEFTRLAPYSLLSKKSRPKNQK